MRRTKKEQIEPALVNRTRVQVRFSETDAMGVVWHGNYLKFFEDGREAFGQEFGLGYHTIYENGYTAPVVDIHCQFKHSLTFGDVILIETGYLACEAAKLQYSYRVLRESDQLVMATGESTQVFLNSENELELVNPKFFKEWKEKQNL